MKNWSRFYFFPLVITLVITVGVISSVYGLSARGGTTDSIDPPDELPVVGTLDNLKKLLQESYSRSNYYPLRTPSLSGAATKEAADLSTSEQSAANGTPGDDHSTTNLQVAGVDEADLVKTDGEYIYQVNRQKVVIAQAYPADQMKITSTIEFPGGQFTPQELYLDERYLVVIGTEHHDVYIQEDGTKTEVYPPIMPSQTVKAVVFDITDKANLKQLREVELEGRYVSSRKIGPALYLVAQKYIHYYSNQPTPLEEQSSLGAAFRDTASGDDFTTIDYKQIRYFPDFVEPNYVVIAGVDLSLPQKKANISTYLGASENIYASLENLYVAVTNYQYNEPVVLREAPSEVSDLVRPFLSPAGNSTRVYRFALKASEIKYTGTGEVPGRILNQFSMDEFEGRFRIATTVDEPWRSDLANAKKNSVYVLDENLNIQGRLEDIAPGERIYSVRFMGERGYLVTFEKVDPFFVIDLKDPQNPKLLGALKIPGYSDYLHPYDENHIIGIGKDTVELPQKDWQGNVVGTQAYYQGMKMAIFDVSDVTQPKEMFTEKIGDRGTDSELLRNHKALLFSREKNLLSFPVTLMEVKDGPKINTEEMSFPQYGTFTFQGAYVYQVDLTNGFKLRGRITHMTDEDYLKAGNYYRYGDKNVERIIYIKDTLYTLSKAMIKANGLDNLEAKGTLMIP